MNNAILKEMHRELKEIRKKLELLEEMILPTEEVSEVERKEIEQLKEESLQGKNKRWKDLKKEMSL